MKSILASAGLLLIVIAPLSAQREVARRSYSFFDTSLTVQVISESAGVLRIMRGEHGRVEVAARARDGFPGFALGGREGDELRLTALGAEQAEFLVIVPEDVRVRVSLPDRRHLEIASRRPAADYTWGAAAARPAVTNSAAVQPGADGLYLSYSSRTVPRQFSIGKPNSLRRLEIRFEGTEFRVATSRPVSVQPGRADAIDFRPGEAGLDVVLSLPYDTRDFRLVLAGKLALEARNGEVRPLCDQLVAQWETGRRIFTFHPGERLICR